MPESPDSIKPLKLSNDRATIRFLGGMSGEPHRNKPRTALCHSRSLAFVLSRVPCRHRPPVLSPTDSRIEDGKDQDCQGSPSGHSVVFRGLPAADWIVLPPPTLRLVEGRCQHFLQHVKSRPFADEDIGNHMVL